MDLDSYLSSAGISSAKFAAKIDVDPSSVWRFRQGVRIPRRETMQKIIEATDGSVTANDFFSEGGEAA